MANEQVSDLFMLKQLIAHLEWKSLALTGYSL